MRFILPIAWIPLLFSLTGCTGYRLGSVNTYGLHTLQVPVFKSNVYVPRIEEQITNSLIRQFQMDGSIRILSDSSAEAILLGEIISWERRPLRFRRDNVLIVREYRLIIGARITLQDRNGTVLMRRKRIEGETTFFVRESATGDDLVSAERQAFPVAADDLARNIVTQVVESWDRPLP